MAPGRGSYVNRSGIGGRSIRRLQRPDEAAVERSGRFRVRGAGCLRPPCQTLAVESLDPFRGGQFNVGQVRPGPTGLINSGPLILIKQSQYRVDSETASLDTGGVRAGTAQGAGPVRREAACALCRLS